MNNKGFAVSSILYTILICFLMFLGAAMAMFSSSNSLVVSANDDIINGTGLKAKRITATVSGAATTDVVCDENDTYKIISSSGTTFKYDKWNQDSPSKMLIKVDSRYGPKFWPRDFSSEITKQYDYDNNGNLDTVYCSTSAANLCVNKISYGNISDYNNYSYTGDTLNYKKEKIIFVDIISEKQVDVEFRNPCNN